MNMEDYNESIPKENGINKEIEFSLAFEKSEQRKEVLDSFGITILPDEPIITDLEEQIIMTRLTTMRGIRVEDHIRKDNTEHPGTTKYFIIKEKPYDN